MTFTATGPPQLEQERAFELARLQLSGFFYYLTYDSSSRKGGFWLGCFSPLHLALRGDWGNHLQRGFMEAVNGWEPRIIGLCADGFFKVVIRRHPTEICWSWAVEWNHNVRAVGFFGEHAVAEAVVATFPARPSPTVLREGGRTVAIHGEVPLATEDDLLFEWNAED